MAKRILDWHGTHGRAVEIGASNYDKEVSYKAITTFPCSTTSIRADRRCRAVSRERRFEKMQGSQRRIGGDWVEERRGQPATLWGFATLRRCIEKNGVARKERNNTIYKNTVETSAQVVEHVKEAVRLKLHDLQNIGNNAAYDYME
ncbi:hypothetical protein DITRI_Ditri13aG0070000 [Diplodiscus trichospermus]